MVVPSRTFKWHRRKGASVRRAPHRDKAEPAIIAALRKVGATVEQLNIANGPDLIAGFRGLNFLLEVKTPGELVTGKEVRKDGSLQVRRAADGDLSEGQAKWHARWRGHVAVVRSPVQALIAIGATGAPGSLEDAEHDVLEAAGRFSRDLGLPPPLAAPKSAPRKKKAAPEDPEVKP